MFFLKSTSHMFGHKNHTIWWKMCNFPSSHYSFEFIVFLTVMNTWFLHPFTTSLRSPWGLDMKLYISNTFHETNIWWCTFIKIQMHQPLLAHFPWCFECSIIARLMSKGGPKLCISFKSKKSFAFEFSLCERIWSSCGSCKKKHSQKLFIQSVIVFSTLICDFIYH